MHAAFYKGSVHVFLRLELQYLKVALQNFIMGAPSRCLPLFRKAGSTTLVCI